MSDAFVELSHREALKMTMGVLLPLRWRSDGWDYGRHCSHHLDGGERNGNEIGRGQNGSASLQRFWRSTVVHQALPTLGKRNCFPRSDKGDADVRLDNCQHFGGHDRRGQRTRTRYFDLALCAQPGRSGSVGRFSKADLGRRHPYDRHISISDFITSRTFRCGGMKTARAGRSPRKPL
jgi:hypothetical protein